MKLRYKYQGRRQEGVGGGGGFNPPTSPKPLDKPLSPL